ncbi:MAG: site-specific integrase [Nanoarchaeota archaeon]
MNNLQNYKDYLKLNFSSISAKTYIAPVEKFFRSYSDFNQETVNKFFLDNLETWKPVTRNKYIKDLQRYASFDKITIEWPKRKKENRDFKQYITEKEVIEITDKISIVVTDGQRSKVFLLLLFYTGLRPKEIINLKKEDFKLDERKLIIRNTKGHKDRYLVLPKSLISILKNYFEVNEHLFNFKYSHITYLFEKINEYMAPRFKLVPYSFRRGFAHWALKKNKNDINAVSVALGHKHRATTYLYTEIDENEAFETLKKRIK